MSGALVHMEAASASEPIEQTKKKVVKPLSKAKLQKHLAAAENTGVVYLSHIPPFLKPNKLRDLLSGMGTEVLRVYLAPEDTKSRAGRLRAGGNKKKKFTEGWVEFEDKRRAKRIASTLNNTPVCCGGFHCCHFCVPICARPLQRAHLHMRSLATHRLADSTGAFTLMICGTSSTYTSSSGHT